MRELKRDEIESVDGCFLPALAAAVLIYEASDILYQFGKGFSDGLLD